MLRIFFVVLLLLSFSVHGAVYKCPTEKGVVYAEHPCAENAQLIDTHSNEPSAADVEDAKNRTARLNDEALDYKLRKAAEPVTTVVIRNDDVVKKPTQTTATMLPRLPNSNNAASTINAMGGRK